MTTKQKVKSLAPEGASGFAGSSEFGGGWSSAAFSTVGAIGADVTGAGVSGAGVIGAGVTGTPASRFKSLRAATTVDPSPRSSSSARSVVNKELRATSPEASSWIAVTHVSEVFSNPCSKMTWLRSQFESWSLAGFHRSRFGDQCAQNHSLLLRQLLRNISVIHRRTASVRVTMSTSREPVRANVISKGIISTGSVPVSLSLRKDVKCTFGGPSIIFGFRTE